MRVRVFTVLFSFFLIQCFNPEVDDENLHMVCEVHLDELRSPVVGIREIIGPEGDPNEMCDLYLFNYDFDGNPLTENDELIHVESGRWLLEEIDEENFVLEIEPLLISQKDDGLLVCLNGVDDRTCIDAQHGTRTVCDIDAAATIDFEQISEFGHEFESFSVVSVDVVSERSVAVTWLGVTGERTIPFVTWLSVESDGALTEQDTFDLCESCGSLIPEASEFEDFIGFQTAVRDDAVLIPGPCGFDRVVEVNTSGCQNAYSVVSPDLENADVSPQFILSIVETAEGYSVVWTDGRALYSSMLSEGDGLVLREAFPIGETQDTQSRETPSALCANLDDNIHCLVAWTELTRLGERSGDPPEESSVQWDFFSTVEETTEVAEDMYPVRSLGQGFGQRFIAGDDFEEREFEDESIVSLSGGSGILVSRHPEQGILSRSWFAGVALVCPFKECSDEEQLLQLPLADISSYSLQISSSERVSDFSMTHLHKNAFGVAWIEHLPNGTIEPKLGLVGIVDRENRSMEDFEIRLTSSKVTSVGLVGLDNPDINDEKDLRNFPKPLIDGYETFQDVHIFLAYSLENYAGVCETFFGMASLDRMPPENWDVQTFLDFTHTGPIVTEGACEPTCGGLTIAVNESTFIVGLPHPQGIQLYRVSDDAGTLNVETLRLLGDSGQGCHADVQFDEVEGGEEDDWTGKIAFDSLSGGNSRIELFTFTSASADSLEFTEIEIPAHITPNLHASQPSFAIMESSGESFLIWSEQEYVGWEQNDFSMAKMTIQDDDSIVFESFGDVGNFPVVDSRVSVATLAQTPCSSEVGDITTENLCGLVSYSRPDFAEFDDASGYARLEQLAPVVEMKIYPLTEAAYDEISQGDIQTFASWIDENSIYLIKGEEWRGIPVSLLPSGGNGDHAASFSKVSPLDWSDSENAGFRFLRQNNSDSSKWVADEVDLSWLSLGEDVQDYSIPFLRLVKTRTQKIAGLWTENNSEQSAVNLYFGLANEELGPFSASVPISQSPFLVETTSDDEEDENDKNAFKLMTEHSNAALGALSDTQFVVSWIEFDPMGSSAGQLKASQILCQQRQSQQANGSLSQ